VVGNPHKSFWLVVAAATLVAQVVPQAAGGDCERGCCKAAARECCASCPAETSEPPCHCRLDDRQDQPLSSDRGTSSEPDMLGRGVVADAISWEVPHAPGVSREYVTASLSVPIRPVRILCGVWRN